LRARGIRVCTSGEVLPEYREFERWSTTVVNAYVTPLIDRYLGALERKLGGGARLGGSAAPRPVRAGQLPPHRPVDEPDHRRSPAAACICASC
jgi:hypothetical protein